MLKSTFWRAAFDRAVKTMAQAALALISTGALGIVDVDWLQVLSVSALAGLVSVLTSLAGTGGIPGTPQALKADPAPTGKHVAK
ncbi:MAG: holin [Renibacterium salmoninarum]|nr:holin [Renibacterium salmoninarum]